MDWFYYKNKLIKFYTIASKRCKIKGCFLKIAWFLKVIHNFCGKRQQVKCDKGLIGVDKGCLVVGFVDNLSGDWVKSGAMFHKNLIQ